MSVCSLDGLVESAKPRLNPIKRMIVVIAMICGHVLNSDICLLAIITQMALPQKALNTVFCLKNQVDRLRFQPLR